MKWQKYPKNARSIRNQQPKTLDSNLCPTYPAMESGAFAAEALLCLHLVLLEITFSERPKVLIDCGTHVILICFTSGFMARAFA